jgi:hypothetical protein
MAGTSDFSQYSDEEIRALAKGEKLKTISPDFSSYSDEDIRKMAKGEAPTQQELGMGESFVRGAGQAFALGYLPQAIAGAKRAVGAVPSYEKELEKQKQAQEAAWEQHPWAYGGGFAASFLPAAAGAVLAAPEAAAVGTTAAAVRAAPSVLGALRGTESAASLAAKGIRGITGTAEGIAPAAGRIGAGILEKPIVQGAIYGSSEGEDLQSKLQGAALGAAGTAIAAPIVGAAGRLTAAGVSKLSNAIAEKISGSYSAAQIAADAAKNLGVELPAAAVSKNPIYATAAKADLSNHIKNASADTLNQTGAKISEIVGDANPEAAGNAVKGSFIEDWIRGDKPGSFAKQLEKIYEPARNITSNRDLFNPSELQSAMRRLLTEERATVIDPQRITSNFAIVNPALTQNPNGLTLSQMRLLRQEISDGIDFSRLPGETPYDEKVLLALRNALTKDMKSAASSIGGESGAKVLSTADAEASKLYGMRSALLKKMGGTDPSSKSPSSIYNNMANMAFIKKGDYAALKSIKDAISPDSWNNFVAAFTRDLMPQDQFRFATFMKKWNGISPQSKDLIWGKSGTSEIRSVMDNIEKLGKTAGNKLDYYGSQAPSQSWVQTGEVLSLPLEAATSGFPMKALGTALGAMGAGAAGARNIAANLPPASEMSKLWSAARSNPELMTAWNNFSSKVVDPTLSATSTGKQIIDKAASDFSKIAGAQAGVTLTPIALKYMAIWLGGKLESAFGQADGGRIERRAGGRVTHEDKADQLIAAADRAKRHINRKTEPLLQTPDEAVAKALAVANQAIGD